MSEQALKPLPTLILSADLTKDRSFVVLKELTKPLEELEAPEDENARLIAGFFSNRCFWLSSWPFDECGNDVKFPSSLLDCLIDFGGAVIPYKSPASLLSAYRSLLEFEY